MSDAPAKLIIAAFYLDEIEEYMQRPEWDDSVEYIRADLVTIEDAGDDYRLSAATRAEWAERALIAEADRDELMAMVTVLRQTLRTLDGWSSAITRAMKKEPDDE